MKKPDRSWYSLPVSREIREARTLWEEIFPEDSREFLDYYHHWKTVDNQIMTRHSAGELVSMVHWNPYELEIGGESRLGYYIVAVATKPAFRHQGRMAGLLRQGMEELRRTETPMVFLMPADPEIYLPFQFAYIYDKMEAEIEDVTGMEAADPGRLVLRSIGETEREAAAAFAEEQLCGRYGLYTHRDAEYLELIQEECRSEGGDLEGIFEGDRMIGLLSWWGEDPAEIRELITEPAWESGDRREQLLAALCRRWSWSEGIRMITTGWMGERKPIIMGRILHLPVFLSSIRSAEPVELRILVEDPLLPDNNGGFLWKVDGDSSVLTPLAEEPAEGWDLQIRIEDLLVWLTGYRKPEEMSAVKATDRGREQMAGIGTISGVFLNEIV